MIKNISDKKQQGLDYSKYEYLLQRISSVQLENIASLKSCETFQFDESCKNVSATYYRKIQDLLNNIKEVE